MREAPPRKVKEKETPKAALIGLLISFVMVMVFRGFFFESFHIPTGSMAPTLNGQHLRFRSPHSGFDWAVNPWMARIGNTNQARPVAPDVAQIASEPITGLRFSESRPPLRGGDRIGIIKYNPLFAPSRWDVAVVKWPASPQENYIKRLVGMPGEQLWFVDGDVFTAPRGTEAGRWGEWRIQRKPDRVQRALWWPEFSSEMTPLDAMHDGRPWRGPWAGEGWSTSGRVYEWSGDGDGSLRWDAERWPITDWSPYNDVPFYQAVLPRYAVSDVRVRASVEALGEGLTGEARVRARGHEFRALLGGGQARLQMRPASEGAAWIDLAAEPFGGFAAGEPTPIEFWHVDQTLELWVGDRLLLRGEYAWDPMERLVHTLGRSAEEVGRLLEAERGNPLAAPDIWPQPGVEWRFAGAGVRLHRVGLDRDIHYQAATYNRTPGGVPALGTHPRNVADLEPDEFFLAGDNSANSTDSRLVEGVEPWVAHRIDATQGVVHRRMVTGKAAVVFWPASHGVRLGGSRYNVIPDFGRMRFIR